MHKRRLGEAVKFYFSPVRIVHESADPIIVLLVITVIGAATFTLPGAWGHLRSLRCFSC